MRNKEYSLGPIFQDQISQTIENQKNEIENLTKEVEFLKKLLEERDETIHQKDKEIEELLHKNRKGIVINV
mgnify:CR=1 FL=1